MIRETDPELSKYFSTSLFMGKSTTILTTLCRPLYCVNNKPLLFQVQFLFLPLKSTQIFSNTVHGYCINTVQSSQKLRMETFEIVDVRSRNIERSISQMVFRGTSGFNNKISLNLKTL